MRAQRPSQSNGDPRAGRRGWALRDYVWQVLYILYSLEVGVFLLFLPWLGIWENNYLLFRFPHFRPIVSNAFLKGAVLGLGIVNILIGIQEIANFKKNSQSLASK